MTGNSEAVIAGAIASVAPWVDTVLVIDTGVTDKSLQIARDIAGGKLVVRGFPWIDDFAAARNFALAASHETGADWAVMVDTDETIDLGGVDARAAIESAAVPHLMLSHESGTYSQARFFRLPAVGKYVGPTHEAYAPYVGGAEPLEGAVFRDKPKTETQTRAKAERDVRVLRAHILQHPDEPRWLYYLGDALQVLGRLDEAIETYRARADRRGWAEESAWACYRMAECYCGQGRWAQAVDACASGLARHAGIGELAWLAGYASFKGGESQQAVWWARQAIALGCYAGCGPQVRRTLFRYPFGLYEGPYNVLHFALKTLGDEVGAADADRLRLLAIAARTQT